MRIFSGFLVIMMAIVLSSSLVSAEQRSFGCQWFAANTVDFNNGTNGSDFYAGETLTFIYSGTAPEVIIRYAPDNSINWTHIGTLTPTNTSFSFVIPQSGIAMFNFWATQGGRIVTSFTCEAANVDSEENPDSGAMPPDDRINWQLGDAHIGIVFFNDAEGLDLYDYETETYYPAFVTVEMVEEGHVQAEEINEPIKIAEQGLISVYVHPSGDIQVNLGPDSEGKLYVMIISTLFSPDFIYRYYEDPNE